jgi:hypothetical protein
MRKSEKLLFWFLLALPVINAAADSTIYYFVEADNVGGLHPGLIRGGILIVFIILFGVRRLRRNRSTTVILTFLGFLFILTLFSSDPRASFLNGYIKWFVPLLMFPVGVWFIRSNDRLINLAKIYVIGASLVCINLVIAQFIGFGISAYVENSFFTGGAGVGITNQLTLVLLTYPVLFRVRSKLGPVWRWFIYIVGLLSLGFVLLAMKRSGILSLMAGTLIYIYLTQSRVRFLRYFLIAGIAIYLVLPAFQSVLSARYNARMKQMENIENEARYQEFFYAIEEFREAGIGQKLVGKELFNTGPSFGKKYFNSSRMIHSDMTAFFYGSGLIGLILYFLVFVFLFLDGRKYRIYLKYHKFARDLFAVYYALLLATFIISVSGSGTIGERCLVFLFLGAVIGVAQTLKASETDKYINSNGSISSGQGV